MTRLYESPDRLRIGPGGFPGARIPVSEPVAPSIHDGPPCAIARCWTNCCTVTGRPGANRITSDLTLDAAREQTLGW